MPIDLFPLGEQLAELDLTVRQLEDGSLTVTTDDGLPDEARVRLAAAGAGLRSWLRVAALEAGQGSRVAAALGPVNQALAAAGERGALIVRGDEVRFEVGLEHAPPYAGEELQALYQVVSEGAVAQRAAIERVLGAVAPRVVEPPGPAPVSEGALPSSFLPGAGQRPRDTPTERFGAVGAVPGRSELSPADRQVSGRQSGGRGARAAGGGGAVLIVVGLAGLLLVGGGAAAGLYLVKARREGAVATAAPGPPAAPAAPSSHGGEAPVEDDVAGAGLAGEPTGLTTGLTGGDGGLAPAPEQGTSAAPRPRSRPPAPDRSAPTEAQVLADARDPAARLAAVEAWLLEGLDRAPGARRRLLEALGDAVEADAKVGRLIMRSLRDRPPSVAEAVECLAAAPGGVRRVLVQALSEASEAEAEAAARALAGLQDTADLQVEEALLRLGRPRDGAPLRLATVRGPEWVLFGDGRPLLEALARRDVRQLRSLFEHPDAEVRMSACALVAGAEQPDEALALLAPALRDADPGVRQRAAEGLTALGDPRASWPLARALSREDSNQTRDVLRNGLQRLPLKKTVRLLGQLYARPEPVERRAAVMALDAINKPEAVSSLVAALRDPDRAVRLEALRALDASHGQPALRPAVAEGLPAIRELALDRSDRELHGLARQLHYQITGRMPQ